MKTLLMTISAAATAYLSATALVAAAQTPGEYDYLCSRYGLGCEGGAMPVVAQPANISWVLIAMAAAVAPALIFEVRRRR